MSVWDEAEDLLKQESTTGPPAGGDVWKQAENELTTGTLTGDPWEVAQKQVAAEETPADTKLPWAQKYNIFKLGVEAGILPESLAPKFEPPAEGEPRKGIKEAVVHGFKRGGVIGVKGIAGLAQMAGEFLEPGAKAKAKSVFPALTRFWENVSAPLKTWGKQMSDASEQYFSENPQEAMKLETIGWRNQTKEFLSKPELVLQGAIESSTLTLEGALGTLVAGPVGSIAFMAPPIAGDVYTDSRKEGNSPDTALARAWLTAVPEAAIEAWTLNRKFGLMSRITLKTPMRKALWEAAKLYIRGSAEEGSQQMNRNFWRFIFTDRNQRWTEGIGESMAAGGPIELAMGGAFTGIGLVGQMVNNTNKIGRVEQVRRTVGQSETVSNQQKQEINQTCDKTIEAIKAGEYEQSITPDQAIGLQYGLSPTDVDQHFAQAETRFRELKLKDTAARTTLEKEELAFLSRNRTDIEAILSWETAPNRPAWQVTDNLGNKTVVYTPMKKGDKLTGQTFVKQFIKGTAAQVAPILAPDGSKVGERLVLEKAKPQIRSRTELDTLNRKIAESAKLTEVDLADLGESVVNKRNRTDMSRKELEQFTTALQEAYGTPLIAPEDYGTPVQVAGEQTTMGSVFNRTTKAVEGLKTIATTIGKTGPLRRVGDFLFGIDNTPVFHLARVLDQAGEGVFTDVFDTNFLAARRKEAGHARQVHTTLQEGLKNAGVSLKDLSVMSEYTNQRTKIPFTTTHLFGPIDYTTLNINNKTFNKVTWGELIDFYLISNQQDGLRHLRGGGMLINGVETGSLSNETIADLRQRIENNSKTKAVVDLVLQVGEQIWKPNINETSLRLDGKEIATVDKWWGLEVFVPRKLAGKEAPFSKTGLPNVNLIENKSIFRDRTKSSRPLILRDAFGRFVAFENAVAEYTSFAEPMRVARSLINNPVLSDALVRKGYGNVRDHILTLLKRTQSTPPSEGFVGYAMSRIMPGLYQSALTYNPRVVVAQFTSVGNYLAYCDPKFLTDIVKGSNPFTLAKECQKTLAMSDLAWDRFYMARAGAEFSDIARTDATLRFWTRHFNDLVKAEWCLKSSDLAALSVGRLLAEAEYKAAQKGQLSGMSAEWWIDRDTSAVEGSPEYNKAIMERTEWLWTKTQPSWNKWERSINTSQTGVAKTFLLFRSFHEKSLTICREAGMDYMNSAKTLDDKARYIQRCGGVLSSYAFNATLRALITAAMARELKEPVEYLLSAATDWLDIFPWFGRGMKEVIQRTTKLAVGAKPGYQPTELIESMPLEVLNKLISTVPSLGGALGYFLAGNDAKAEKTFVRAFGQATAALALMYGVPVYQGKQLIKGWVEEPETGGKTLRSGESLRGESIRE